MADIPKWRKNFPQNIGMPTKPKPDKCSACATPIWIWRSRDWLCYNCKLSAIIHDRETMDEKSLDGCLPTGVYRRRRREDELTGKLIEF